MKTKLTLSIVGGLTLGLVGYLMYPAPAPAEPGGCIKYGAVGAVAGHMAGHGVLGAAGGCVAGMYTRHEARVEAERERTERLNENSHQYGPRGAVDYGRSAPPLPGGPDYRQPNGYRN